MAKEKIKKAESLIIDCLSELKDLNERIEIQWKRIYLEKMEKVLKLLVEIRDLLYEASKK